MRGIPISLIALAATAVLSVACSPTAPIAAPEPAAAPPVTEHPVPIAEPVAPPAAPTPAAPTPAAPEARDGGPPAQPDLADLLPEEPPAEGVLPSDCTGSDVDVDRLRRAGACAVPHATAPSELAPVSSLALELPARTEVLAGVMTTIPIGVRNTSSKPVTIDFRFGAGFPSVRTGTLLRNGAAVSGDCSYGALTTAETVRVTLLPGGVARMAARFWANDTQSEPLQGCTPKDLRAGSYRLGLSVDDRSRQPLLSGEMTIVVR